jgi:alpha-1,2-mannosyltransferase
MKIRARLGVQILLVCALVALLGWYVAFGSPASPKHGYFDLTVYRGAARWWLHHRHLYAFIREGTSKGFTYPPFGVLVVLPTALVSMHTAAAVLTTLSALLVVLTTWWLVVPVADRHGWPRWFAVAVAVPLVFAMEPVRETLGWGQRRTGPAGGPGAPRSPGLDRALRGGARAGPHAGRPRRPAG